MDQPVVVVDSPPPPLAKRPTPYHLYLLRLILLPCTYYALFADFKNDIDDYLHVRIVMLIIYVSDAVYFATSFTSKAGAVADVLKAGEDDHFKKMAISLGLRFAINATGWILMWALDVNVRGMSVGVAYTLTSLVDFLLMMGCYEDSPREGETAATEDEDSYLYELPWKPSPIFYCQIALRLAVFCLYIGAMLFDQGDLIPPVHFPVRVIWCILFVADNWIFFSRMYYANPQLENYMTNQRRAHVTRYILCFLPTLYFSLFTPASLASSCGSCFNTALQMDSLFLKEQEKYFKCEFTQREKNK